MPPCRLRTTRLAPVQQRPGQSQRRGFPLRGRSDGAVRAYEQRDAERLLEIAYPVADRRRAEIEGSRRRFEAAGAESDIKRLQCQELRRVERGRGNCRLNCLQQAPRGRCRDGPAGSGRARFIR